MKLATKIVLLFLLLGLTYGIASNVTAVDEVTFKGYDDCEYDSTYFFNLETSSDVILVRSLVADTTTFYVVPPGEYITFFPDGSFIGSAIFESFLAGVQQSATVVKYHIVKAQNMEKKVQGGGWTSADSCDTLTTGDLYRRKTANCSYMEANDLNKKKRIWMGHTDKFFIPGTHKVPSDPRFLNASGFSDFNDFNYAAFDITCDPDIEVTGNTEVTPDEQIGARGQFGEAVIPQRGSFPTLTEWGLIIILTLLLMTAVVWMLRRRRGLAENAQVS